jgi:hypothetical protein
MGVPRDITWTWQSNVSDLRTGYMAVDGRMSITGLIAYMAEAAPDVDPADILVNWATVVWTRPATPDEINRRRQVQAAHDARHEAWELATYERLRAKYDPAEESKADHRPGDDESKEGRHV